jgi:hypothetical protein
MLFFMITIPLRYYNTIFYSNVRLTQQKSCLVLFESLQDACLGSLRSRHQAN